MILEYRTPNGTMVINADVFFLEASIGQIRKMLKGYRESGARDEARDSLIRWLESQSLQELGRRKKKYLRCLEIVKEILG